MKIHWFLKLLFPALLADAQPSFLADFVAGSYSVVGQRPDSSQTYRGTLTLSQESGHLRVDKDINGHRLAGEAFIESAAGGDAQVLRVRFTDQAVKYEQTCLISSDLDNYARISCQWYRQDGKTKRPGLEAWFYDLEKK